MNQLPVNEWKWTCHSEGLLLSFDIYVKKSKKCNLASEGKRLVTEQKNGQRLQQMLRESHHHSESSAKRQRSRGYQTRRLSLPLKATWNQVIPPLLCYHFRACLFVTGNSTVLQNQIKWQIMEREIISTGLKERRGIKECSTVRYVIPLHSCRNNNSSAQKRSACVC